jgi:hypothetical protein
MKKNEKNTDNLKINANDLKKMREKMKTTSKKNEKKMKTTSKKWKRTKTTSRKNEDDLKHLKR